MLILNNHYKSKERNILLLNDIIKRHQISFINCFQNVYEKYTFKNTDEIYVFSIILDNMMECISLNLSIIIYLSLLHDLYGE